MAYDFRKEQKALYAPAARPSIVDVPAMTFLMVDGQGNPNTLPAYANALSALYDLAYAVKMSKMSGAAPRGYFDFVVPPLEGLWWLEGATCAPAFIDKDAFQWTSMLRVPDFVTADVMDALRPQVSRKKPEVDLTVARVEVFTECLCGQITHIGPYDEEPPTIAALDAFIRENGCLPDMAGNRRHHEIYLSDPRKTAPEKMRTLIRHPVVKA